MTDWFDEITHGQVGKMKSKGNLLTVTGLRAAINHPYKGNVFNPYNTDFTRSSSRLSGELLEKICGIDIDFANGRTITPIPTAAFDALFEFVYKVSGDKFDVVVASMSRDELFVYIMKIKANEHKNMVVQRISDGFTNPFTLMLGDMLINIFYGTNAQNKFLKLIQERRKKELAGEIVKDETEKDEKTPEPTAEGITEEDVLKTIHGKRRYTDGYFAWARSAGKNMSDAGVAEYAKIARRLKKDGKIKRHVLGRHGVQEIYEYRV